MKFIRRAARFCCTVAIAIVTVYLANMVVIAILLGNGTLTADAEMWTETPAPTLSAVLAYAGGGVVLVAGLLYARKRLL